MRSACAALAHAYLPSSARAALAYAYLSSSACADLAHAYLFFFFCVCAGSARTPPSRSECTRA